MLGRAMKPWKRFPRAVAWVFLGVAFSAPAAACPRCAAGQEARRQVWADGIFRNLAAAGLPFILMGAISARLHRLGHVNQRPAGAACRHRSARGGQGACPDGAQDT